MIIVRIASYFPLLFSLIVALGAFGFYSNEKLVAGAAPTAKAQIIQTIPQKKDSRMFLFYGLDTSSNFKVRYEVDGEVYDPVVTVTSDAYFKHQVGDTVEVQYSPRNPNRARIPGMSATIDTTRAAVIPVAMIVSSIIFIIGVSRLT